MPVGWPEKAVFRLQTGVPRWNWRAERAALLERRITVEHEPVQVTSETTGFNGQAPTLRVRPVEVRPAQLTIALPEVELDSADVAAAGGPTDLPAVLQRKRAARIWLLGGSGANRMTTPPVRVIGLELARSIARTMATEQMEPLFGSEGAAKFADAEVLQRVVGLVRWQRERLWNSAPATELRADLVVFFREFGDAGDRLWVECAERELRERALR